MASKGQLEKEKNLLVRLHELQVHVRSNSCLPDPQPLKPSGSGPLLYDVPKRCPRNPLDFPQRDPAGSLRFASLNITLFLGISVSVRNEINDLEPRSLSLHDCS